MSFTPWPLIGGLVGPTASGKSEIALRWAMQTGGAILSLDAMQVYRGPDIGTGKPTTQEQARVPHGGIDLVEIGKPFSVADYLQHAKAFLQKCNERQQPVLAVGGTGLYYRALTQGLSATRPASEALRQTLEALSLEQLQERLRALDPEGLEILDANNPRRLVRAIETLEASGKPLRWWHAHKQSTPLAPALPTWCLTWKKEALNQRIAARVQAMFAQGWVEEVRSLLDKYSIESFGALPAIGYPAIAEWVRQGSPEADTEQLTHLITVATRQYAKRQLTWFRRESKLEWVAMDAPNASDQLLAALLSHTSASPAATDSLLD